MANQILTEELLDAFLEGRTSLEETMAVIQMARQDEELSRVIRLYDQVDKRFNPDFSPKSLRIGEGLHALSEADASASIPYTALAADTTCNDCVLACESYIMQKRLQTVDEKALRAEAQKHRWLRKEGTPLYHIGKLLELAGLEVHRRFECDIRRVTDELEKGHDVIVAVDGNELVGNYQKERIKDAQEGETANHAVVVCEVRIDEDAVIVHDPQSTNDFDRYSVSQFVDAWEDSRRFMVVVC